MQCVSGFHYCPNGEGCGGWLHRAPAREDAIERASPARSARHAETVVFIATVPKAGQPSIRELLDGVKRVLGTLDNVKIVFLYNLKN